MTRNPEMIVVAAGAVVLIVCLSGFGAVLGLLGAVGATRVLRTLLYEITPSDPVTYVVIAALLGGAAVLASWVPARRATRVHPTEALRDA